MPGPKAETEQGLTPQKHGGAIKGKTHGARRLQREIRAGRVNAMTREGKAYYAVVETLNEEVCRRLGRAPGPLELIAVEQVAEAYMVKRLLFAHSINQEHAHRGDKEPMHGLGTRYISFANALTKALNNLANMVGTTGGRLDNTLAARLAEMAEVVDVEPVEPKALPAPKEGGHE